MQHVIDQIRAQDPALAGRLAALTAELEFGKILTLLHAHRSEKYEHNPEH